MEKILSKEEIVNAISKMSVMDLVDFIEMVEKKFNISSTNVASNNLLVKPLDISKKEELKVEQTDFKVVLKDFGLDKIKVIKIVRSVTKLGLKESKDLVENLPALVRDKLEKVEADNLKKELELAGATVILE